MARAAVALLALLLLTALTPAERSLVLKAKDELKQAQGERNAALLELAGARDEAAKANDSALLANGAAEAAQKQADEQHKQLQIAIKDVNKYKPVYDKVNRWWGIGGIVLGFSILVKHLLILLAVLVVLSILLSVASFFFPFLSPVLGLLKALWARITSIFHKKQ